MNTIRANYKQTHATFETAGASFQDTNGNQVEFGPSRITVEPIQSPAKSVFRAADSLLKLFVAGAAMYLIAEIFRAIADGAFTGF